MTDSGSPCPACGADPGRPCRTVIDGVDTGWDHDARILAPIHEAIAADRAKDGVK